MTELITNGLVSDHRFNTGDFIDYTDNGHDGTPDVAARLDKRGGVTMLTTNKVVVPNHAGYAVSLMTIFSYGELYKGDGAAWGGAYPFLKNAEWGLLIQANGDVLFATNGVSSQLAGALTGNNVRSLTTTVTKNTEAKFYVNGTYKGEGANAATWTPGSNDIHINDSAANQGIKGVLFYNRILIADEIAQLHDWADEQISISKMKEQKSFNSPMTGDEDGLVMGITGNKIGSTAYDLSPNRHDGECTDVSTTMIDGQKAMHFNDSSAYINFGDDNDFSFGDGSNDSPFSVAAWYKPDVLGAAEGIVGKDNQTVREWALMTVNGKIRLFLKHLGGGTQQSIDSTTTLQLDTPVRIVCTYDGSGGNNAADGLSIYINGVKETPFNVIKNAYTAMSNTVAPLTVGRYYLTNRMGGELNDVMLFDKELSQAEVTTDYEGYNRTIFFDDHSDSNVSSAAQGSVVLENTIWKIVSGTWKVSKRTGDGRQLECVTDGKLRTSLIEADNLTTAEFELLSGTPTLTKNATNIEIDALAGEKIGNIQLTNY